MLNLTASQAVALGALARQGSRPSGTLVYLGVRRRGGRRRAGRRSRASTTGTRSRADYLLTENGGTVSQHGGERPSPSRRREGSRLARLRVRGTPGHGSMPYGADNALVKAASVVSRLADYRPSPYVSDLWTGFVEALELDPVREADLVDPARGGQSDRHAAAGHGGLAWSATHTTFSPNVCRGG